MEKLTIREYTPIDADMGHKLKVEVVSMDSNRVVLSAETRAVIDRTPSMSRSPIEPPFAKPRQWFSRPVDLVGPLPSNCPTLTITSYNMLADMYCRPEMYNRCPVEALSWEYRRNRLAKQVEVRDSGLFCFQEVEKGQFESFWVPEMKKRGYTG